MPKTDNQRQILEDAHTPQARGDAPDLTRFIRFFSSEEVRQIVQRLEQRLAAGSHRRRARALDGVCATMIGSSTGLYSAR